MWAGPVALTGAVAATAPPAGSSAVAVASDIALTVVEVADARRPATAALGQHVAVHGGETRIAECPDRIIDDRVVEAVTRQQQIHVPHVLLLGAGDVREDGNVVLQ